MKATNLDEYFQLYGPALGEQARRALEPLHTPGIDPVPLMNLGRQPFDAQAHVIAATVKSLKRQRSVMLIAEMGTGKTMMGMAAVHTHANGKPYRALVFCPGQLTEKWEREILETIPGATVVQIKTWKQLPELRASRGKLPAGPTWYIIARDRAKLGAKWKGCRAELPFVDKDALHCPKCGGILRDEDGLLVRLGDLNRKQTYCTYERMNLATGRSRVCGEPLWTYTHELDRFEPAKYIHKRLKRFFDYLIIDEAHEEKSASSAQGNAMGSLAAAAKKVIALTGTLIGGYAEHVRPLLFRLAPHTLIREGLRWQDVQAFSERYGRIEIRITEREDDGDDNSQSRGKKTNKTKSVRPGIMPTLFGRHLIGNSLFLGLAEVAENLPPLLENIQAVNMDAETEHEYQQIETALVKTVRELLRKGKKGLLGPMLQTLLAYPDYPFGWDQVGYYEYTPGGSKFFVPVCWPKNLDADRIRPKERALLDLIDHERLRARQVWVYVQYTQTHDVAQRLHDLCVEQGFSTAILRSSVDLAKREQWIAKNGRGLDVVISHPKLVETGLDLFDKKQGGHNFSTLVFYETGYNLFTMRQASRRAWRIGQRKDCQVVYLYYGGTIQERAMALMGKKMSAAQALEGKFSSDGLAAMGGEEGSAEMALARSLAEQIDDDGEASRHWQKLGANVHKAERWEEDDEDLFEKSLHLDMAALSL